MKRHGPWRTLALDPTEDRSAIRRAYADKLRQLDPDSDIEGFTRLRHARDHALVLAKGLATAGNNATTVEADDWIEDQVAITGCETGDDAGDASVLERAETDHHAAQPEEEPAEPTAPQVLVSILFPGGQASEEGLSTDEWALAQPALAAILQQAEDSSVDEHAAIEGWLSHHLASAWPRSAWLLEPAADAFGWMEEAGQLTERPAVQYLNQRLRGMRFVNKVKQPNHVLHKAWTELSRPGPKGTFAFLRAGKDDVARLLAGIRERYPEVESYLDPQRVASWEGSSGGAPAAGWGGSFPIILVLSIGALVRVFSGMGDPAPPYTPPAPVEVAWSADQVDQLVVELFEERLDNDTLRNTAPDLWSRIDRTSGRSGDVPDVVADASRELLVLLRAQSQLAARDAAFDELVAIKQVKLALLRVVREQKGPDDCLDFDTQGIFPANVEVPETLRAEERGLAARLARANLLLPSDGRLPDGAMIPGPVIGQIIDSTGLSENAVRGAIRGDGNDEVLCDYRIALLEAVLKRPGQVSADLLRIS